MAADKQSPAESMPEPSLLALARKKFGALSPAEEELFRAAQEGRGASALGADEKENDPANAANWKAERVVSAECIAWVCTDPQASALMTRQGLELNGMRIDGVLNLENAEMRFALRAWKCAFSEEICLRDTTMAGLFLVHCQIRVLNANRATVKGSLFLRYLKAEGEINLVGGRVGSDLECSGAQLLNAKGDALNANGATIEGHVFLRDGFKAEGEINLVGGKVGGTLDCSGAQLSNANGIALNANRATIGGSIFFRNGFKAEGEINLIGGRVGSNLECDGAQLSNAKGVALNASGATIEANILLRKGFKVEGEVNLVGTKIGGSLECIGAQFSNSNALALNANSVQIAGSVSLSDGCSAEGEVNLLNARIGRNLDCSGAQFSKAKVVALSANGAQVERLVLLRGFTADNEVDLKGINIGGDLDCTGAQLSSANGRALDVQGSRIQGCVYLREGFRAHGEVSLLGATIGPLQVRDVLEAEHIILDLRLAKVEAFWDDEGSWPKAGNLFLDGFRYGRLYDEAPFDADSRKKWLSLQPRNKYWPQPYEQLATVLRQMGHEPEARQVRIEKNRERARFTSFPYQSWWWYNLVGKFIGYGYAPWRAFCLSLGMIFLGTCLFYWGANHDLMSPTSENAYEKAPIGQVIDENGPKKMSEAYPAFHAFIYSLESFVPLLKLDQSAHWRPNANRGAEVPFFRLWTPRSGELLRDYLCVHIAAGWLLTSLWVGAITGLVKT
jgi:sRNA-binding regulator protein Hfq